jgi:ribosome maturation factor RimP
VTVAADAAAAAARGRSGLESSPDVLQPFLPAQVHLRPRRADAPERPGLERQLRTPAHFQREVGKTITIRLRDPQADPRRLQGALAAADERTATLLFDDGTERIVAIDDVDKARTVFHWGPTPKPGKQPSGSKNQAPSNKAPSYKAPSNKEKQES